MGRQMRSAGAPAITRFGGTRSRFCRSRRISMRFVVAMLCLVSSWPAILAAAEPLIRLDLHGETVEGTPLTWAEKKVFLLARDGQLLDFAPAEATNFSQVGGAFRSYSQAEIRGLL